MKRGVVFGIVGALLITATGCGGADSLMKSIIADMNALADAMEKGEPADKQKAIADRIKANGEKLDKMKLSDDEKKKLVEKYKGDLEKAMMRLMAASMKAGGAGGVNMADIFK